MKQDRFDRMENRAPIPAARPITGTQVPVTAEGRGVAQQARPADVSRRREPSAAPRCPICGGLNPGDMSHTRCM